MNASPGNMSITARSAELEPAEKEPVGNVGLSRCRRMVN